MDGYFDVGYLIERDILLREPRHSYCGLCMNGFWDELILRLNFKGIFYVWALYVQTNNAPREGQLAYTGINEISLRCNP